MAPKKSTKVEKETEENTDIEEDTEESEEEEAESEEEEMGDLDELDDLDIDADLLEEEGKADKKEADISDKLVNQLSDKLAGGLSGSMTASRMGVQGQEVKRIGQKPAEAKPEAKVAVKVEAKPEVKQVVQPPVAKPAVPNPVVPQNQPAAQKTGMDIFKDATKKAEEKAPPAGAEKTVEGVSEEEEEEGEEGEEGEGPVAEGAEGAETAEQEKSAEKKILTGHTIPTDPSWHLKRNKTGFTLPPEVRSKIPEDQDFAVVVKDNELHFYMINEDDIPKLNLVKKPKEKPAAGEKKKTGGRKKREIIKEPTGPQPEWGKYFLFEFEDNDKVQAILETVFDKFVVNPPLVQEAMDVIKYALVNFIKNNRMNDSRLRQTIIFFMCDIIEKFNQPNLIDFIRDKIVKEVKSSFLYQLSLNQLTYTCFKMNRYEQAQQFISLCITDIGKYTESEMYAVMDSFKNMVFKLTRDAEKEVIIPQEQFVPVKTSLMSYWDKITDNDYKIQIIDMLDKMHFVDEAHQRAKEVKGALTEDNPNKEKVDQIISDLDNKPV